MEEEQIKNINQYKSYYCVSINKYFFMSICTFGLYEIYWNYKNWQYIKTRDKSNISPVWRSIFYPLWFYSLLTDINKNSNGTMLANEFFRIFLAVTLLILNALWRLPDPYRTLSLLTILTAWPALQAIKSIYTENKIGYDRIYSHRPINLIAYIFGGSLLNIMFLTSVGYLNTMVISGDSLWKSDVNYLIENEILGEEERIIYFYSAGMFSSKNDGQFISDDYVTSYGRDPSNGELYLAYSAYEEIADIQIDWSTSFLEETIVTITQLDGQTFNLWLSPEQNGDRLFVNELNKLWKLKRVSD